MALAIMDLDDFKRINDSSGHAAGDQVLRQAATTIATYVRRGDRAFRVGGDEFALVMPDTERRAGPGGPPPAAGGLPRRRDRPRRGPHRLVLGGHQRRPERRPRPRGALPPGRRGALLEQAPRPDVRDRLRRRAPRRPDGRAAARRAVGGRRPGRRDGGHPRGLPADLRPHDRRAARLRGPRPAAAGQRLRRSGLAVRGRRGDRPDRRARHRLPRHGHGDRGPAAPARLADRQPVAAHARARRLQRPRPAADDRPPRPRPRARSSSS